MPGLCTAARNEFIFIIDYGGASWSAKWMFLARDNPVEHCFPAIKAGVAGT